MPMLRPVALPAHRPPREPQVPLRKLVLLAIAVGVGFGADHQPDLAVPVVLALASFSALDRFDRMIS